MDFKNIANKYKDEMVEKLSEFVTIKSTLVEQPENKECPFGEECKRALEYILDLGKAMGFATRNIDNVCGHIEYGEGDEIIGVLCHVDVVPAEGVWESDPYIARIENDRLYARGSIDDKGPAISSLYALKMLKDNNVKLNKKIRLIIGTDEESGSRGLHRYLEVEKMPDLAFSPDAEFPLIYGEKGIMSIDIISHNENEKITVQCGNRYNIVPAEAVLNFDELLPSFNSYLNDNNYEGELKGNAMHFYGQACHAMEPRNGINAALRLCGLLKDYSKLALFAHDYLSDSRFENVGLNFTDYEMGDMTCNFAVLNINNKEGKIGLNFRYPVRWAKDEFIKTLSEKAASYGLELKVLGDSVPHYISPEDDLVKTLLNSYQELSGDYTSKPQTIGGGTYARGLKRAVAFGQVFPHEEDLAHQANEYISISNMVLSTAIYAKALCDLGK